MPCGDEAGVARRNSHHRFSFSDGDITPIIREGSWFGLVSLSRTVERCRREGETRTVSSALVIIPTGDGA